jgi:hypothetical protein
MSSAACKPFVALYKALQPWLASEYTTTFFFGLWLGYFIMEPNWYTFGGLAILGAPLSIYEYLERKKQINSE